MNTLARRALPGAAFVALVLALTLAVPSLSRANSPPVVTNVTAAQTVGTGLVVVHFDVSDADGDSVVPRLVCSSNDGTTFDLLPIAVSGDINKKMVPGTGKTITWNAAADWPGRYWAQVVAKVYASDGTALTGEMVLVPAGNFTMGSTSGNADEQPQHTVYLDAFTIDKYEVTCPQFQQFMDAGGYTTQAYWSPAGWSWRATNNITAPLYWGNDTYHNGSGWPGFPVVGVSWYEAEAYANFAGRRLPTEAEWEKAARGTDARTYPWGEGIDGTRANYSGSGDHYDNGSTPVGYYDGTFYHNPDFQTTNSPGPYVAYDQVGNVWEWVHDWYSATYYGQSPPSNPQGPLSGSSRVLRGGSWGDSSAYLRCAQRSYGSPYGRSANGGFRCARTAQ